MRPRCGAGVVVDLLKKNELVFFIADILKLLEGFTLNLVYSIPPLMSFLRVSTS